MEAANFNSRICVDIIMVVANFNSRIYVDTIMEVSNFNSRIYVDIIMEVARDRGIISRGSGLRMLNESSMKGDELQKDKEESESGSRTLREQSSTNKQGSPQADKIMERVGSVEYTRNANYDEANGMMAQPDLHQSRFALWRAQADQDMIHCIKEDGTHHTYFTRPPVNPITLFFDDNLTEKDYRKKAWQSREERRSSYGQSGVMVVGNNHGSPRHREAHTRATWSPSGFNAIFDLFVSMFTFLIVCLGKLL